MRAQVYRMLEDYNAYLGAQKLRDWADIPYLVLENLEKGAIEFKPFDMILIDEAQDFAPSWIKVIQAVLKEQGAVFLADDPTQSIYRYFSWKEKGIQVVGRTMRLNIPYRNTYEIYKLAYEVVHEDPVLQQNFEEEGVYTADFDPETMRHGPKPLLVRARSAEAGAAYLRSNIDKLLQQGVGAQQIAVLHRRTRWSKQIEQALKGLNVKTGTFHAFKGMEFDSVFLCDVQETFQNLSDDQEVSEERRLLHMAITRARQRLIMTYQGSLPKQIGALAEWMDVI